MGERQEPQLGRAALVVHRFSALHFRVCPIVQERVEPMASESSDCDPLAPLMTDYQEGICYTFNNLAQDEIYREENLNTLWVSGQANRAMWTTQR